jgi:hypothetical protein
VLTTWLTATITVAAKNVATNRVVSLEDVESVSYM